MLCKLTANTNENLGHVCILYEVLSCFQFCEQLTSMKALTYSFDKYERKNNNMHSRSIVFCIYRFFFREWFFSRVKGVPKDSCYHESLLFFDPSIKFKTCACLMCYAILWMISVRILHKNVTFCT